MHLKLRSEDQVAQMSLARGKTNAMNHEMLSEISAALVKVEKDPGVRALVIASGSSRLFSPGFDVAQVFTYDRHQMTSFFATFINVIDRLARFSKPTIASINGHAYAGGAILALACDFRVMAAGSYGFAVNEINLGFAVPACLVRVIENAVGVTHARNLLLTGQAIDPRQAERIGLAYEVVDPAELQRVALGLAGELADKTPQAYAQIKHELTVPADPSTVDAEISQFIEDWFSPEAETRKAELARSLRR